MAEVHVEHDVDGSLPELSGWSREQIESRLGDGRFRPEDFAHPPVAGER